MPTLVYMREGGREREERRDREEGREGGGREKERRERGRAIASVSYSYGNLPGTCRQYIKLAYKAL